MQLWQLQWHLHYMRLFGILSLIPMIWLHIRIRKFHLVQTAFIRIGQTFAFCAAIWSVTALAVSVWVPDKLLTIIIPVCIYHLWSCRIFYHLFGINTPHPGALYNDALTVQRVWQSLVMYGILFIISLLVYVLGLKRRTQNV